MTIILLEAEKGAVATHNNTIAPGMKVGARCDSRN